MKLILLSLLSAGMMLADVKTFDNLPTSQPWLSVPHAWDDIPAYYAGLNWVGWEVMNQSAYTAIYGDGTALPSSPNFAYAGVDTATLSVGSATPFQFIGAQFAGWPKSSDPVTSSITIDGYLGGKLVGSTTLDLSATEWRSASGITAAVDTLEFIPADRYFRMDNLEIVPTPEPATVVLLCPVFVGLGFVRRRNRRLGQ